ncbi:GyrI-like domain-containing protein [Rhodococcus sp. NPDC003322]
MSELFSAQPHADVTWLDLDETHLAVVRYDGVTIADLPSLFDAGFGALGSAIGTGAVAPIGPAVAIYHGDPSQVFDLEIGFPIAQPLPASTTVNGALVVGSGLPAGPAAALTHLGPYDLLATAWEKLMSAVQAAGATIREGRLVEVYVTEPTPDADPKAMRTDVIALTDRVAAP